MANLDGAYRALGEELTRLSGYLSTRLTAVLAVDAVVATVESTIDWPDAGLLYIEGERIPYTARTETTFSGLTRDPQTAVAHRRGTEVADGSRSFSQADKLRADRLVTRAARRSLDRWGWQHGERRPLMIGDDNYRDLLRLLLFLDRGPWWALFRVLRICLRAWVRSGTATTALAHPQRLSGAAGTWSDQDVGRPVAVGNLVYRVREVAADGSYADLHPGRGYWWCAGNFGDGNDVDYHLLPFRMLEIPSVAPGEVLLDVMIGSDRSAPPSYLLGDDPPGTPEFTPVDWPLGSEVLEDEMEDGSAFSCWYLPGLPEDDAFFAIIEEVVPAGVNVRLTVTTVAP